MKRLCLFSILALAACGGSASPSSSSSPASPSGTSDTNHGTTDDTTPPSPSAGQNGGAPNDDWCMPPGTKSGDACSAETQSCSSVKWCDTSIGALVTDDAKMTCTAGTWQASGGGCPLAGEVNSEGCPLTQPDEGTACTVDGTKCHYGRECVLGDCMGAPNCVAPKKALHGYSECTGGSWVTTTALAACP